MSLSVEDLSSDPSVLASLLASDVSAPSSVVSTGFSGSLTTVGAATVAMTKSLSVIVGATLSGSLIEDIFILAPMSKLSRSTISSSGIFSAGHFNSTFLLTIFNTPPVSYTHLTLPTT